MPGFRKDNGTHLYYWFFEARHNPETAPLVFWFTGGPGCSGLTALFLENGPYKVDKNLQLTINPYSWNEQANLLFVRTCTKGIFWHPSEYLRNYYSL